jgi:hypothetical protein
MAVRLSALRTRRTLLPTNIIIFMFLVRNLTSASISYPSPCAGGLLYLHYSPASSKRRQKRNPVVSNETVKYGHEFCRTLAREWLLWQGPEAIVRINYSPILSSERAPHIKKPAIVRQKTKSGHGLQLGARHRDWLAGWTSVVNWLQLQLVIPAWKLVGIHPQ